MVVEQGGFLGLFFFIQIQAPSIEDVMCKTGFKDLFIQLFRQKCLPSVKRIGIFYLEVSYFGETLIY